MQDDPAAAQLLTAIADTLEARVMPNTEPATQHQVRVAVNLCRIVAREVELDPAADRRASASLADLLGHDGEARELWNELAGALTPADAVLDAPSDEDEALARHAHPIVLSIVRDKIAVAKPGYDDYDFAGERV